MLRIGMCGSRQWQNSGLIYRVMLDLKERHGLYTVVYGAHWDGADRMILGAAKRLELAIEPHPAEWDKYAASVKPGGANPAGQIRNRTMAYSGLQGCCAFRSKGKSNGTDGMVEHCHNAGVVSILIPENVTYAFVKALIGALVLEGDKSHGGPQKV